MGGWSIGMNGGGGRVGSVVYRVVGVDRWCLGILLRLGAYRVGTVDRIRRHGRVPSANRCRIGIGRREGVVRSVRFSTDGEVLGVDVEVGSFGR